MASAAVRGQRGRPLTGTTGPPQSAPPPPPPLRPSPGYVSGFSWHVSGGRGRRRRRRPCERANANVCPGAAGRPRCSRQWPPDVSFMLKVCLIQTQACFTFLSFSLPLRRRYFSPQQSAVSSKIVHFENLTRVNKAKAVFYFILFHREEQNENINIISCSPFCSPLHPSLFLSLSLSPQSIRLELSICEIFIQR